MSTTDCQTLQQAVFEAGDPARALAARPDLAAHADTCAACRDWLVSFAQGVDAAGRLPHLGERVVARTAGAACARARDLLGAAFDEPLDRVARALVDAHLETCPACRDVAAAMDEAVSALPALAEIDPGPAFTRRVLAATSRRPAGRRAGDRWRAAWTALVARPRFALEAAYVLTLVLVLLAGSPLSAWQRTMAQVKPVARTEVVSRIGGLDQAIGSHLAAWRDSVSRSDAVRPSPSGGPAWLNWIRQTVDAAIGAAGTWMRGLVAEIEALANGLQKWMGALLHGSTEPAAAAARSRQ